MLYDSYYACRPELATNCAHVILAREINDPAYPLENAQHCTSKGT